LPARMAEDDIVKVAELVDDTEVKGTPQFKDAIRALFGVRSGADIKALIKNEDLQPHVYLLFLVTLIYILGIAFLASGA
jgi:hypothetical protein